MDYLNINDYLPLSEAEIVYKNIFIENPQFAFHEPKTPKEICLLLDKLDTYKHDPYLEISSKKEFINEKIFPNNNDVIVKKHIRYSPCFLHSHSFFEIIYVLNGSCINKISNQSVELKTGHVCIIAPGTVHAVSAFNDDCIIINLLVKSSTFETAFLNFLKSNDILSSFFSHSLYSSASESYLIFTEQHDIFTINSVLNMYRECTLNLKYSERMLNALMNAFFINLLRTDSSNIIVPNPSGKSTEKNIIFILNHIFSNYKDITLKDLSSKFSYSERHMARILKEYTGKNFIDIIQDIKTQKACELLKNPDISINKIVDLIGYSNSSHFYRVFKKQYNMTPKEYRNQYLDI